MIASKIGIEAFVPGETWRLGQQIVAVLTRLFQELSPYRRPLDINDFLRLANKSECLLAVDLCQNGHIVGIARLVIERGPDGPYGVIHDVVVDQAHRGHGIGRSLIQRVVALARGQHLRYVDALVKPARVEFNRRCESLGFELISSPEETGGVNHYRLML